MNRIPPDHKTGKIGELLVQLKLLVHDIQAAPPIYDSGNDLIAIHNTCFRAVQVKTSSCSGRGWNIPKKEKKYHVLALVRLAENPNEFDRSNIYLFTKNEVEEIVGNSNINHEIPPPRGIIERLDDSHLLEQRLNLFDQQS